MQSIVFPSMARCAYPRPQVGDVTVTHPAQFGSVSCSTCGAADAGSDTCPRCWYQITRAVFPGIAYVEPTPPAPRRINPVSPNGHRLPLRAIPYRQLNREFWSKGQTLFQTERSQPRELLAHEKQPEDMTWQEIDATLKREPLSESRRSWLIRGAGVMRLEALVYGEGSIGETLAAKGFEPDTLIEIEPEFDLSEDGNHDAVRFGTPLELLDPITAKQIDWEKEQHGNSDVATLSLKPSAKGGITLAADRKLMPDRLQTVARSAIRSLTATFGPLSTLDDLHARLADMQATEAASGVTRDFTSADPDEERERFLEPAPREWHSSYDFATPVVAILSDKPMLFGCTRRGCTTDVEHRHERITRTAHRSVKRSQDELWHNRIFDVTAYELGTDGLVDPLVSF